MPAQKSDSSKKLQFSDKNEGQSCVLRVSSHQAQFT